MKTTWITMEKEDYEVLLTAIRILDKRIDTLHSSLLPFDPVSADVFETARDAIKRQKELGGEGE